MICFCYRTVVVLLKIKRDDYAKIIGNMNIISSVIGMKCNDIVDNEANQDSSIIMTKITKRKLRLCIP